MAVNIFDVAWAFGIVYDSYFVHALFLEKELNAMNLTIIISYYRALHHLKLVLKSLNQQSENDFEVIVSEDDYNAETIHFILKNKNHYRFPIQHLYQKEDVGFRKNMMLNKSIVAARSKMLAFIDGDCIPHQHFVKEYYKNAEESFILVGRRVKLGKEISTDILKNGSFEKMNFWRILFSDTKKKKEAIYYPYFHLSTTTRGLLGCNWGVQKQHLLAINGFDEDYVSPGVGEDDDVEWRLKKNGLKVKSIKNKVIVYHLYHEKIYSKEEIMKNNQLFEQKKQANHIRCLNGIEKIVK